jgi:hypothetical protein
MFEVHRKPWKNQDWVISESLTEIKTLIEARQQFVLITDTPYWIKCRILRDGAIIEESRANDFYGASEELRQKYINSSDPLEYIVDELKMEKIRSETISDWFKKEAQLLDDEYRKKRDRLSKRLAERQQEECKHEFEKHDDLFYSLGETYPGMLCDKCGAKRHLNEDEK